MRTFEVVRRRLSYANVMATLALFFALTGSAMAGAKFIVATDTIPATSDLAGSTYGNPQIAAGKVTTGKIANGAITSAKFDSSALAPDADKLDGSDSSAFQYSAGSGLDLAGNQFSVGPGYRLPQDCGNGQFPSSNGPGSGWGCGTDTTYSGADFALSNQSCAPGQMVAAISAAGAVQCAAPPSPGTVYGFAHVESNGSADLMAGPGYAIQVRCGVNPDLGVVNNGNSTLNRGVILFSSNIQDVIYAFFAIVPNGSITGVFHNTMGTFFLSREDGSIAVINAMEHDSADGSCNFWAAAQNKP